MQVALVSVKLCEACVSLTRIYSNCLDVNLPSLLKEVDQNSIFNLDYGRLTVHLSTTLKL
jgi:hypothetical protein